eukprot:TRINITY_DN37888_c0_g1_i1.p1 TRINITY_DN37888_c0_g1~~TRINITY_DN37888_c0_g1_i1.p1  ORF type:complete len:481 (-),score=51.42 TRINITY_DN37888_c0_g1_i1:66-1508(-)
MDHLRFEWQKTRADWRPGPNFGRRLGLRALPAAAAAVVSVGGLSYWKRRARPEKEILNGRAAFTCANTSGARLPNPAEVRRSLQEAGAHSGDIASLCRAARRMRGPIERDLVAVERSVHAAETPTCSPQALRTGFYRELLERWRGQGFLDEPEEAPPPRYRQGIDLVTQRDESYGRDIGCEAPLCILQGVEEVVAAANTQERPQTLDPTALFEASGELESSGVVRLRGLLSQSDVEALRERLYVQTSALDHRRRDAQLFAPVRTYDLTPLQEEDPDLEPALTAPGRRHLYLRGRHLESAVRHVIAGAMPLVWEHFARTTHTPATGLYLSELQLLVADPCAVEQFWHVDNAAGGLTVFVPLTSVSRDIGPTHVLPGTHRLLGQDRSYAACASAFLDTEGVPVCTMEAGDALVYDARTFHRCAANRRYDRSRLALVFRFDVHRPPGIGAWGTLFVSWTGSVLASLQRLYSALPASPPPARAA